MFRRPIVLLFIALALVLGLAIWRLWEQSVALRTCCGPQAPTLPEFALSQVLRKAPGEIEIFPADPVRGSRQAAVRIVQFSDFECPFCAEASKIVFEFIQANPTKAYVVWKDFPLPEHEHAQAAALAAQCAAQQGKFWEYHDKLFESQASLDEATYTRIASEVSLGLERFNRCRGQRQSLPLVARNIEEGRALGVDGTPFFIIGGQVISGSLTQAELEQLVAAAAEAE